MKDSVRGMKIGHPGWIILYDQNSGKEINIFFPIYIDFDEKTIESSVRNSTGPFVIY